MIEIKSNIALIGFMGTGKTSIAKDLATKLKKEFIHTDDFISVKAGKSIPKIFEQDGEQKFRELEIEVVKEISDKKNVVIDCGGGVILNVINIERLKKNAKIILLTASPEVILERVLKDDGKRPLLYTQDKMERIKELLFIREPLYKKYADYEIDTSNMKIDQAIEKILKFMKKKK
jgi:shikimate kinase